MKEEKLGELYTRINRRIRRSRIYLFSAIVIVIAVATIRIQGQFVPPQYHNTVYFGGIIIGSILIILRGRVSPSYEKRIFRDVFAVYQNLGRYLKISDMSTIKKKNLKFVISPLHKVSDKLRRKPLEGKSDLISETNEKYAKVSGYVKTKIIAYLQKNKEIEMVRRRILRLAEVFSDANMEKVDSYLESIKDIPDEEFHVIPSRFETIKTYILSNPLLRVGGKFLLCLIFATIIAYFLSIVLFTPLGEFAPYILVASFALFAAWEKR